MTKNNLPGILSGFADYPEHSKSLRAFAESLMVEENEETPFNRLEREMIATFVSALNQCEFCANSHGAVVQLLSDSEVVDSIFRLSKKIDFNWIYYNPQKDLDNPIKKMLPFFKICYLMKTSENEVRKFVEEEKIPLEMVHQTILIASAFQMFNIYVQVFCNPGIGDYLGHVQPYLEKGREMLSGYVK